MALFNGVGLIILLHTSDGNIMSVCRSRVIASDLEVIEIVKKNKCVDNNELNRNKYTRSKYLLLSITMKLIYAIPLWKIYKDHDEPKIMFISGGLSYIMNNIVYIDKA